MTGAIITTARQSHLSAEMRRRIDARRDRVFTRLRDAYDALEKDECMKPAYRLFGTRLLKLMHRKVYVAKLDESTADALRDILKQEPKFLENAMKWHTENGKIRFEQHLFDEQGFRDMARTDSVGAEFFSALCMEMFRPDRKGMTEEEIAAHYRYRTHFVNRILETTMELLLKKVC